MGKHAPMPAYMKGQYDNKALLLIKMTRAQLAQHIDKWRAKYKEEKQ